MPGRWYAAIGWIVLAALALIQSLPAQTPPEILIRNGLIVTEAGQQQADLRIRGEDIVEIGRGLTAAAGVRTIDATGKLVLPGGIDTRDLFADALRAGVLFAPGYVFQHDGRASSGLRLTVARTDEAAIRRGVALLARVVRERLAAGDRAAGAGVQL